MHNDHYPPGTVRALLQSDFVSEQTKKVLTARLLKKQRIRPPFFEAETFTVLQAVCDCLFPQDFRNEKIPLAIMLEEEVATGKGKGWRFDTLPPTKEAIPNGLNGLNDEAKNRHCKSFPTLSKVEREQLLIAVQKGVVVADCWKRLPPALFFTELLALLAELYYSHPLAKEEIGEVAFADVTGWQRIGLNNLEPREPLPFNHTPNAAV